jgi:Rps23 Pro-64 3,4-dihydroxylase Tpa1-like proline 4-hydroxylase
MDCKKQQKITNWLTPKKPVKKSVEIEKITPENPLKFYNKEFVDTFEADLPLEINDPYVYVDLAGLSPEICDEILQKFEAEPYNHYKGVTAGGLTEKTKKTIEINVTRTKGWEKYDSILQKSLNDALNKYSIDCVEKGLNMYIFNRLCGKTKIIDTGYQIQKYIKQDGHYMWHHDASVEHKTKRHRIITYLWYLNDVEEGGETFFYHCKVKPQKGKLVMFPATWNYNHCGNTPTSNDKYIITGWVYLQNW